MNLIRRLSYPLQQRLADLVYPDGTQASDFLQPSGEAALVAADSVSWQVFANPVAMLVGGVAAVLLELAEPRVRTGVWEHTSFRREPLTRLRRTGYAAMVTAFGARSRAERMIGQVNRGHARIAGQTPGGVPYRADDPELLTWVHATATFGFLEAYMRCVRPLPQDQRDRYYRENVAAARLYGVACPPADELAFQHLCERMRAQLEPSPIVAEFIDIMEGVALLPPPARALQRLFVRAAVQCLPSWARQRLALDDARWSVAPWQWSLLRAIGRAAEGLDHPRLPAVLARRRLAASPDASSIVADPR